MKAVKLLAKTKRAAKKTRERCEALRVIERCVLMCVLYTANGF